MAIAKGVKLNHRVSSKGLAFCLCLSAWATASHAMSLDAIRAELSSQPVQDTFDVKITTTVLVGGQTVSLNSHVIAKGPDKLWMEQESPGGVQRIIRNGEMAQSINLRTGQKQTLNKKDLVGIVGHSPRAEDLFGEGRFAPPRSIGDNRYQVDMIPGTDLTTLSRSVVYDAARKTIVKIMQVGSRQDTSVTEFSYGLEMGRRVMTRMKMDIRVEGMKTQMQMDYSNYAFPKSILDGLFIIKE